MPQTIGEALLNLKARSGLSLRAIAYAAGYSGPSSVQAFFHPNYDPPGLEVAVAHKLVAAFQGKGSPAITVEDVFALTRLHGERASSQPAAPSSNAWGEVVSDVPVYETKHALGKIGFFENSGRTTLLEPFEIELTRPIRYFPRPLGLNHVRSAFAFHIAGNAMAPRYRDGEPIFIDPTRSPSVGDHAFLVLNQVERPANEEGFDGAMLGLLVGREPEALCILQYATAVEARIPNSKIGRAARIVPWSEICGVAYG